MTSKVREKIKLVSTGKTKSGAPTKTFYTTTKNKKKHTEKIVTNKYDPRAFNHINGLSGMYVPFKEDKIK